MSWVKLKTLYGERFRSYVDRFEVVFPESGLTLVKGENLDTGDTSDSGKSTLLMGIAHLFGGGTVPATELQSWHDEKNPFLLGATFETSEGLIRLERHKQLVLTRGKEKFRGKAADEELDRLFGMDAKLRGAATYRGQDSAGLLLSLSDQEKKTNLAKLVPELAVYERIAAEAAAVAKQRLEDVRRAEQAVATAEGALGVAEKVAEESRAVWSSITVADDPGDVAQAEISVTALRAAVEQAQSAVEAVASRVDDERFSEADDIEKKTREARAHIGEATSEMKLAETKLAEMRRRLRLVQQHDETRRLETEKTRSALRVQIASFDADAKRLPELQRRVVAIQNDLDRQACDRCKQGLPPDSPAAAEVALVLQREKAAAEAATESVALATQLREQLAGVPEFQPHEFVPQLTAAVQLAENELHSAVSKRDAADRKRLSDLTEWSRRFEAEVALEVSERSAAARKTVADCKAKLAAAEQVVAKLRGLHAERNRVIATKRAAEEALLRARSEVDAREKAAEACKSRLTAAQTTWAMESDVAAAAKGFLGAMVRDVLNEVADGTNEILAGVANVREIVFRFDHDEERITPVVVVDGESRPLKSGLSGGMASVVNLAVDLAYGAAVAKRRGSYPGWISLDESFGGLGTVSLETVLEMLEKYAAGRLVLCIDHSSEFCGQFNQVIKTQTSGRRSRIVV